MVSVDVAALSPRWRLSEEGILPQKNAQAGATLSLSLRRSYQISLLNDLVIKIAGFGATLLSCHVNPGPYKVVYLGLVWVGSYG